MEAREFRDTIEEFNKKRGVVLGIWLNSLKAQGNFRDAQKISFTVLYDGGKSAAQADRCIQS